MDLRSIKVETIMSKDLICVGPNDSLLKVDELFEAKELQHMPVKDEANKLVGIISKKDILLLKDWGTRIELSTAIAKNKRLLECKLASEIMSSNVVSVSPDTPLSQCFEAFKENRVHSLPVVADGKLIGIVTTYDLINLAFG